MLNSLVGMPVPVTVHPLRMLGGGNSTSQNCINGHPAPRGMQSGHSPSHMKSAHVNPRRITGQTASAAMPLVTGPLTSRKSTVAMSSSTTPPPRRTITIFAELDDEVGDGDMRAAKANRATMSNITTSGTRRLAEPDPLTYTQTVLSPLSYSSLCQHANAAEAEESAFSLPSGGLGMAARQRESRLLMPGVGDRSPEHVGSGSFRALSTANSAELAAQTNPSFLSGFPHGTSWTQHRRTTSSGSEVGDPHHLRISATPVVPIVPHVAEPASRKRVAEDMQRLYGGAGVAAGSTAVCSTNEPAQTTTSAAKKDVPWSSSCTGSTADASHPLPPATRKDNKRSLLASFTSSTPKHPLTVSNTKTPPSITVDRVQAREQIIRVGVQRLHQRLNELHLVVHRVRNDGNCQFRAISHQLFGNEDYHDIIRSQIVSYMRAVRAKSFDYFFESPAYADAYYNNLAKSGSWGDELSLRAASDCLYVNIHVLSSQERNCYITYRPSSEQADSAPSFLVDVWTLRERRRAERRLLRAYRPPPQQQYGHRNSNAFGDSQGASLYDNPQDMGSDGEDEMDANAIQVALHRRLQQSEIRCSWPLSGTGSCSNGGYGGDFSSEAAAMPLLQPQSTIRKPCQLLQPAAVPARCLISDDEDDSGDATENQRAKFRAVGAEVQALDTATQAVNISIQRKESANASNTTDVAVCLSSQHDVDTTLPPSTGEASLDLSRSSLPRPRLHHHNLALPGSTTEEAPASGRTRWADTWTSFQALSPTMQQGGETGEIMLLASNMYRGRANPSLHRRFSSTQKVNAVAGWADNAQSNSHALSAGGGESVASSQLLGSLGLGATTSFRLGTDYGGSLPSGLDTGCGGAHAGVRYVSFEPRTEPIDIFLSYLYPVHYNSLSVSQESEQVAGTAPRAEATPTPST
ncbi:hypothetical protein, conserved [Leishmania tarentolae]|uniref:OTU domain-containing protein n=1 Tax=Leishmania tarentolae TaxID=5689 RepID=A0A640KEM4_LEITA|nr:hypothetical protein, conserved [Leishmania tarentolae]